MPPKISPNYDLYAIDPQGLTDHRTRDLVRFVCEPLSASALLVLLWAVTSHLKCGCNADVETWLDPTPHRVTKLVVRIQRGPLLI